MFEAEVKLALPPDARQALLARLRALGARPAVEREQIDLYFEHPARSFDETDEALRLRLDGGRLRVTYKGPKLDPPRKTREEIELAIDADLAPARRLLERLGFVATAEVRKHRIDFTLDALEPGRVLTVSLDDVHGLGSFCEVEVQASDVADGRAVLERALASLGLGQNPPISDSYLELLRAAPRGVPAAPDPE